MANCPTCGVRFSSPYLLFASHTGDDIWCPRGHRLEFRPPGYEDMTVAEQLAELERLYAGVSDG